MSLKDFLWKLKASRKAKITLLVVLLLGVVTAAGYVLFGGGGSRRVATSSSSTTNETKEERAPRAIDGVVVAVAHANAYPTAVVIENLVAARPQAGLADANLVYEFLAEGGITRFLAVYASGVQVPKIGPVRSARPYFLDVVKELGALFVHAGGSSAALAAISTYGVNDFNQFYHGQYFDRDPIRLKTFAREHTLYTNSELLARALRDTDAPLVGSFDPWLFRDDAPLADRPTEPKTVTVDFSSFAYKVGYAYNREKNVYERSQGEQPHIMEDGKRAQPKNVVVQYVATKKADSEGRLEITMTGEGEAVVFQNGTIINATWKKPAREARTRYFDSSGNEIRFVAGATWVELVPSDQDVTYS